jgi:hypothetical protein
MMASTVEMLATPAVTFLNVSPVPEASLAASHETGNHIAGRCTRIDYWRMMEESRCAAPSTLPFNRADVAPPDRLLRRSLSSQHRPDTPATRHASTAPRPHVLGHLDTAGDELRRRNDHRHTGLERVKQAPRPADT